MMPYDGHVIKELKQRIADDLTKLHSELGAGTLIVADNSGVSTMRMIRHIGRIDGLKMAIALIRSIEDDMSGKNRPKGKDE